MAYVCEINPNHRVYLDNQGNQTLVTTVLSMPGQQQQSSSSLTTGEWTAPPKAYKSAEGIVLRVFSTHGELCIDIQNNNIRLMENGPSVAAEQQLSVQQTTVSSSTRVSSSAGMQPMQPMQPMTLGNMQMTMNPMEMRMGTMELKMNSTVQTSQPETARKFCSQCGVNVAPEDRFCASCGHALS